MATVDFTVASKSDVACMAKVDRLLDAKNSREDVQQFYDAWSNTYNQVSVLLFSQ